MSVKVMGLIWDCDLSPNHKLVLLAYADHADHNGRNIWPAVDTVARKTSYSRRQVQRTTSELVDNGLLEPDGKGPRGTNKYRIPIENLPLYMGGDNMTPPQTVGTSTGGDNMSRGGDILTRGVTPMTPPGVTPMTPEPSFNHPLEPSVYNAHAKGWPRHEHDPADTPSADYYARRSELVSAIAGVVKTVCAPGKTEGDFNAVADALIKQDATPEQVDAFAGWWKGNGYYKGKPSLKSFMDEFNNMGAIEAPKEVGHDAIKIDTA